MHSTQRPPTFRGAIRAQGGESGFGPLLVLAMLAIGVAGTVVYQNQDRILKAFDSQKLSNASTVGNGAAMSAVGVAQTLVDPAANPLNGWPYLYPSPYSTGSMSLIQPAPASASGVWSFGGGTLTV